jgi:hypothetical protein
MTGGAVGRLRTTTEALQMSHINNDLLDEGNLEKFQELWSRCSPDERLEIKQYTDRYSPSFQHCTDYNATCSKSQMIGLVDTMQPKVH